MKTIDLQGAKKKQDRLYEDYIKQYFIRVFISDTKNAESEIGFLGWDWCHFITHTICSARDWGSRENALKQLKKIVEEKPAKMSDGKVYPPNEIHHIGNMSNRRDKIEFRLSVVELDVEHISMKELDFCCGTVSFDKPQIVLTASS